MKKFQFTLKRLHEYKQQVLDEEKNRLKALHLKLNEIEDKIVRLERDFVNTDRELKAEQSRGTTVICVRTFEYRLESIRYQIKQLRNEQAVAAANVDRQIKVVVAASQEVAGLDKLEEKQMEEYQHEVAKDNELIISEYVSSKVIREPQGT